jgi:hypothetical protein
MIHSSRKSRQPHREAWTRDRLLYERSIAIGSSLDASSYDSYSSALNSYIAFCQLHNFDADPTEDTLSFYVVFMSHQIKPDSVDSYLSGICNLLEPYYPDVRKRRSATLVSRTLKGCKRLRNTPTKRRSPLLPSQISLVIGSLSPTSSHDDVLFVTLLATGFHGLMRLGELTTNDTASKRSWRKTSLRHTVSFPDASTYSFILTTHKADATYEGNTILIRHLVQNLDPRPIFKRYLASRDSAYPLNPELWLTHAGTRPTRSWFIRRLRAFFPDHLIAGQSMRAGGATCLASTGALPAIIQAAGRWSSNAFQLYIRKNPFLLHAILAARRANHSRSDL